MHVDIRLNGRKSKIQYEYAKGDTSPIPLKKKRLFTRRSDLLQDLTVGTDSYWTASPAAFITTGRAIDQVGTYVNWTRTITDAEVQ